MANTTEVFRFITIRNPKKIAANNAATWAATVNTNTLTESVYVNSLIALRSNGTGPQQQLDDIKVAAQNFKNSGDYISTANSWNSIVPGLQIFWDAVNSSIGSISGASIKTSAENSFGSQTNISPDPTLVDEILQQAWENLITYNILGENRSIIDFAQSLIKAQHLLQNLTGEDITISQISRPVILPETIFPLPFIESPESEPGNETPDNGMSDEDVELVNNTIQKDENIKLAILEIETILERQVEEAKVQNVGRGFQGTDEDGNPLEITSPILEPLSNVDTAFRALLTTDTVTVLTDRNFSTLLSASFVIKQLTQERERLNTLIGQKLKLHKDVVQIGGALLVKQIQYGSVQEITGGTVINPGIPIIDEKGIFSDDLGPCKVRPLGVAEYLRVEQTLLCYKPGEVAHIENILKGEAKERTTRRLSRSEITQIYSSESETTDERDTITTDRYQMEKETSQVLQKDQQFNVGVQVQGQYGAVNVQANSSFSTASSSSNATSTAVAYAKDVTTRALKRVVEKTREERITTKIEEFEDTNKHVIDNTAGTAHTVGLYSWVDKIFKAEIVNYGKRLMFQFMVPDPAAFHRYALLQEGIESNLLIKKPLDPVVDIQTINNSIFPGLAALRSPADIDASNYLRWAGIYSAKVEAPPQKPLVIGISKSQIGIPNDSLTTQSFSYNDLVVPEGYVAKTGYLQIFKGYSNSPNGVQWLSVNIGNTGFYSGSSNNNPGSFSHSMNNETGVIPLTVIGRSDSFAFTAEVQCEPSAEMMEAWKLKAFKMIMEAYNAMLAEYNNAIVEAKANASIGINIRGTNPAINRKLEQMELQKHCVRLLSACTFFPSTAMKQDAAYKIPPEFECCQATRDGKYVQFVESCFEWPLMTYTFYPYFWHNKAQWKTIYQLEDADPIFLEFLQAGYARVIVPVREGFESAALRFVSDGTLWNGGDVPTVNDPYFLSLLDEMKPEIGSKVGDPWEIRVPTTLTILQEDASGIDGEGLPCNMQDGI